MIPECAGAPRFAEAQPGHGAVACRSRVRRSGLRGRSIGAKFEHLRPVEDEQQDGRQQQHPCRHSHDHPGHPPAERIGQPLCERWVHRDAYRESQHRQAEGEAALAVEPLRCEVARAEHQRALPEEPQRAESEREQHESAHRAERDGCGPERGPHRGKHGAHAVAVDQSADVGQPERGDERRERIGARHGGPGDAQILGDRQQEDAEGVRLSGAAREHRERGDGEHHPAVVEAVVGPERE